jgi:hypothetical protein
VPPVLFNTLYKTFHKQQISAPACLPEPGIGESDEIFEVDRPIKVEICYVSVNTKV